MLNVNPCSQIFGAMIDLTPSAIQEAEYDEESGYFFRRLGEVSFGSGTTIAKGGPAFGGVGNRLAVANRHGIVIYSDGSEGMHFYCVTQ